MTNAVNDALRPFGVTITEIPLTPQIILTAWGEFEYLQRIDRARSGDVAIGYSAAASDRARLAIGHHHLDGVLDPLAGVSQRRRQVGERKCMGVDFRRIEPLFRHQRHGAAGGAAAFAANAVDVDVVLHQMRDIHRHRFVRKCGQADLAAAIGHVDGLIDRRLGARAFDDIVRADPAGELLDDLDGVLIVDIDDAVGAEFLADREPPVARSRQDHRACAERFGDRHREQPDRARADHDDAFAGDQSAELGQAVHRRPGGDDQRRLRVAHGVGHPRQRVDVIDGVFGEAAVGGEAVGAMALVGLPIVQARGVHALAAALALAAAGMDFHADAFADLELVDVGSERGDRAHIFMARREILVEGQAALNARRRADG